MNRLNATILSAVATASLAACGGGGGTSVTELVDTVINRTCDKAHECKDSAPFPQQTFEALFGATRGTCNATYGGLIGRNELIASVNAGRIDYDESKADACLAAFDVGGLTCEQFWNDGPGGDEEACDAVFTGAVADGDACTMDLDCAGANSYCDEETLVCTSGGV